MKTHCTSRLAFRSLHVSIGFALYAAGLVLAFDAMSSAAAGDNATAELSPSLPEQDPGRWKVTGSMTTARYVHTATLLPNRQVLVAGGAFLDDGCNNGNKAMNESEGEDKMLMARLASGDSSALGKLYRKHHKTVEFYARNGLGLSDLDVADTVQDVFKRVQQKAAQ
jgi:hypothetical protein